MMLKQSLLTLLTTAVMTTTFAGGGIGEYDYSDSIDASRTHPGSDSIPLEKVPMFICFGWDDNGIADKSNNGAATWIREYLKDKKNPAGSGQKGTFDGTPMRSAFYFTTKYVETWVYEDHRNVRKAWDSLYADGHEIGAHSTFHLGYWDEEQQKSINFDGTKYSKDEWFTEEIDSCLSSLTNTMKFDASDLYGWRTPRLEWNDSLFTGLVEKGFVYDCSIESDPYEDGKELYWPHTLNNGTPLALGGGRDSVTSHPGFWELPAYRFMVPDELQPKAGVSVVSGLDYNVWVHKTWGGLELSGPDFTEILNHNLDLRMEGNRCPFLIGLHSDIYSGKKDADYPKSGGARGRQKAIEDFIDYAIETYPEVRFVTGNDIITWMRNPVALATAAVLSTGSKTNSGIFVQSVSAETIKLQLPKAGRYSVKLFTVQGAEVQASTLNASEATVANFHIANAKLTPGIYMVQVETAGTSMAQRINIQ